MADATDAGAEGHHHDVVRALPRPGVAFAEQGGSRVVLEPQRQAERSRHHAAGAAPARRRTSRWWRAPGRAESTSPQKPKARPAQSASDAGPPGGPPSAPAIAGSAPPRPRAASSETVSTATTSRSATTAQAAAAAEVHREGLHHDRSISSRLLPLVSGITRQTKRKW